MKRTLLGSSLMCLSAAMLFSACSSTNKYNRSVSDKTGWNYNDKSNGGFDVADYQGQQTGPGLKFVEGGRFTMGMTEEDVSLRRNNIPRTVSVSSFYMDETEVANVNYREYIYWLTRAYNSDYPDVIRKSLPDTTVWRDALSYNEPMVKYYFRTAAYDFYPVVGVNWYQAQEYCKWRSDRVNEQILIQNGVLKKNVNQVNEDVFNSDAYLYGQYEGTAGGNRKRDLDPNGSGRRPVSMSDGYLLPDYRLPTEAEWEYAAVALIGNNPEVSNGRRRGEEVVTNRNVYTWGDPNTVRSGYRNSDQGKILANFMRGRGDAMGVAGGLNDNALRPAPVYSYQPNAFGLYNMAGNVNEWVLDTYRPENPHDVNGLNPFRGNVYETYQRLAEDQSLQEKDSLGNIPRRELDTLEIEHMRVTGDYSIRTPDLRGYKDGDSSNMYSYEYGKTTLISDNAKIYKGGSWADRAYWLSPGTKRFMQAWQASSTIGFRCVMDRLGSPNGMNDDMGGNSFNNGKKNRGRK